MALQEYTSPKPDKYVTIGGHTKTGEKNPTSITGYLMAIESGPNKFDATKTATKYLVKTVEGLVCVNANTNMVTKVKDSMVQFQARNGKPALGAKIAITYTGLQKIPGKNDMKLYSVQLDADDMVTVFAVAPEAPSFDEDEEIPVNVGASPDDEDDAQERELAAAERKARVDTLLRKNKKGA